MKKLCAYLFLASLFIFHSSLNAQNRLLIKADDEFQRKNYSEAIVLYEKILKSRKRNYDESQILKKIGFSCAQLNLYSQASEFYKLYLEFYPEDDEVLFQFADQRLKSGSMNEAKLIFERLLKKNPNNKEFKRMLASCNFAIDQSKMQVPYRIQNLELINSKQSEFGIGFFYQDLVFGSQRIKSNYASIHGRTNEGFSDLYRAAYNSALDRFDSPTLMDRSINSEYNEGSFTYDSQSQIAYFTRCKKEPAQCQIFKAHYNKGKWVNVERISFDNDNYDFAHPALSKDGRTLFFSSNMPGGLGGHDIWKTFVTKSGKVGRPVNLGANINTSQDEMFPFVLADSVLLYSSKGHVGMGGMDIYYSKMTNGVYEIPVNVGAPINSTQDDFSIIINDDLNGGYFCSNRNYIEKSDDIYAFYHNIFLEDIRGKVADSLTFQALEGVRINFTNIYGKQDVAFSDSSGVFILPLAANSSGNATILNFQKTGFNSKTIMAPQNSGNDLIIFLLDNTKGIHSLVGKITDKGTSLPLENAMLVLTSYKGLNDTTFTDQFGKYTFSKIFPNDYLILRVNKQKYLIDSRAFQTPVETSNVEMSSNTGYDTNFDLVPVFLKKEFEIENIYYEFDEANLLPQSQNSLNKLVNLLVENPGLQIQINSHTDERGTDSYNLDLSMRRSLSVVSYLVDAGINKSLLLWKGFGESKPEIRNATTDEEHQKNRRTTFEIIGQTGISFPNTALPVSLSNLPDDNTSEKEYSTSLTQQSTHSDNSIDIENKISYRVQFAALAYPVDAKREFPALIALIDKLGIYVQKEEVYLKYQIGELSSRTAALKLQKQLVDLGFSDSFIVEIKN